jgi:hypothetical protein
MNAEEKCCLTVHSKVVGLLDTITLLALLKVIVKKKRKRKERKKHKHPLSSSSLLPSLEFVSLQSNIDCE